MMLDLVTEEERISHLTGMAFEPLLRFIDELHPVDLVGAYEMAVDRYMVLASKGRRDSREQIELDRLDSTLRFLLGEQGLLVIAGHLLWLLDTLRSSSPQLLDAGNNAALASAALALGQARARCHDGLLGTRLPVPVQEMIASLDRAGHLARCCASEATARPSWLPCRRARQASALSALAEQLAAVSAGTEAWRAARVLAAGLRPARAQRLANGLLALSAWLACHQAMHAAARALADCAELIRESLKA